MSDLEGNYNGVVSSPCCYGISLMGLRGITKISHQGNCWWCPDKPKWRAQCLQFTSKLINSKDSFYRAGGADKSLARPTSRCILYVDENISFSTSLVIYIVLIRGFLKKYPDWNCSGCSLSGMCLQPVLTCSYMS